MDEYRREIEKLKKSNEEYEEHKQKINKKYLFLIIFGQIIAIWLLSKNELIFAAIVFCITILTVLTYHNKYHKKTWILKTKIDKIENNEEHHEPIEMETWDVEGDYRHGGP